MALIGMKEILGKAYANGYGVGGFDGWDSISIMAVLEESKARKSPVVMICASLEYQALGPRGVAETARALSDMMEMDVCLHLDHGDNYNVVVDAIKGGFSSVMIDGSRLPFAENIAATKKVVDFAHSHGIHVEAELGNVGKTTGSDTHEGVGGGSFTDPDQAAEFVAKSGCDYLAVSIGNAHGLYTAAPSFDFDCLARIRKAVNVPLVLHGGSGTPEDQLKKAVSLGMAKVNVASEMAQAFSRAYAAAIAEKKWWAQAKNEGKAEIRKVIGRWIGMLGSEGKA